MNDRDDRRRFLTQAAAAVAGAMLIGGCEDKDEASAPGGAPAAAPGESEADRASDARLITDAVLLEAGAVKIYGVAAGLPFVQEDAGVLATATRFAEQHAEHRDRLQELLEALGAPRADLAKAQVFEAPAAALDETKSSEERRLAIVKAAREIEMGAAKLYYDYVTTRLRTPLARKHIADILPVEAQHVAVYDMVLGAEKPSSAAFLSAQS